MSATAAASAGAKRRTIIQALRDDPKRSNREVARLAGVDHRTVQRTRRRLLASGVIPEVPFTKGRDGRSRACLPALPAGPIRTPAEARVALEQDRARGLSFVIAWRRMSARVSDPQLRTALSGTKRGMCCELIAGAVVEHGGGAPISTAASANETRPASSDNGASRGMASSSSAPNSAS